MDSNNAENTSEALLTLQAGFNELIRNAYLQGFKDGREFELKIIGEEVNKLDEEKVNTFISTVISNKPSVLVEAEELLREHS